MMTPEHAFRDRLKRAVEACSLEKREIASRVGLRRPGTLSAWLGDGSDVAMPRGRQLLRLPGVLGISGHWLLTGEGPMRGGEDGLRLELIRQIVDGTIDDDTARRLAMGTDDYGTGELESRYRDLVEYSSGLICTHGLDGVLEWVNPGIATLLGYEPSFMMGRSLGDFLADPETLGRYLRRSVRAGRIRAGLKP